MPPTIRQLKKDKRSKQKRQQDFIKAFVEVVSVTRAAIKAKIHRTTVYDWINEESKEFEKAFTAACEIGTARLEDEAIRRAFNGTNKPVFQGGKKVGSIKEYSDTLLIFLLKGRNPDKYKERFQGEHSGPGGKPIPIQQTTDIDYTKLSESTLIDILNARNASENRS